MIITLTEKDLEIIKTALHVFVNELSKRIMEPCTEIHGSMIKLNEAYISNLKILQSDAATLKDAL